MKLGQIVNKMVLPIAVAAFGYTAWESLNAQDLVLTGETIMAYDKGEMQAIWPNEDIVYERYENGDSDCIQIAILQGKKLIDSEGSCDGNVDIIVNQQGVHYRSDLSHKKGAYYDDYLARLREAGHTDFLVKTWNERKGNCEDRCVLRAYFPEATR